MIWRAPEALLILEARQEGCQDSPDGKGEGQRWHEEPWGSSGEEQDGEIPSKSSLHWGGSHPGQSDYLVSQKCAASVSPGPLLFCTGGAAGDAKALCVTTVKKQHNRNSVHKTADVNGKGLENLTWGVEEENKNTNKSEAGTFLLNSQQRVSYCFQDFKL